MPERPVVSCGMAGMRCTPSRAFSRDVAGVGEEPTIEAWHRSRRRATVWERDGREKITPAKKMAGELRRGDAKEPQRKKDGGRGSASTRGSGGCGEQEFAQVVWIGGWRMADACGADQGLGFGGVEMREGLRQGLGQGVGREVLWRYAEHGFAQRSEER